MRISSIVLGILVPVVSILGVCDSASARCVNGIDITEDTGIQPTRPAASSLGEFSGRTMTDVFIDFDDASAPCTFAEALPLRDRYEALGVTFEGSGDLDGGAILDACSGLGVTGYSSPCFLAFNRNAQLSNGGMAKGPEWIHFAGPVWFVSMLVGTLSCTGEDLEMTAYNQQMQILDVTTIPIIGIMQEISVSANGIQHVQVGGEDPCTWILDDLGFNPQSSSLESGTWGAIKDLFR